MTPIAPSLHDLVRVSRLLGSDHSLVLHGGGNTSLKTTVKDVTGEDLAVLHVKASGVDLGHIKEQGFAPLRLDRLHQLLPPVEVPAERLRNELRCALLNAESADPSVETLIHALLPHATVLHSHADAVLTLGNTSDGPARLSELLGDAVVFVEYAMPGPDLVAAVAAAWYEQASDATEGVLVLGHGLFTVGDTPDEAYGRHLAIVQRIQEILPAPRPSTTSADLPRVDRVVLAGLRADLSDMAEKPLIMSRHADARVAAFVSNEDLLKATQQAPLTPDHVTWTKPVPMIGTDTDTYAQEYLAYFHQHAQGDLRPLDPAPRVVLDQELGMLSIGTSEGARRRAEDIYRHTMDAIASAHQLGGYHGLPARHVFDLEYWGFQQKKIDRHDADTPFTGQVAVVTGAASGIGRGCAQALLDRGACVVGWDLSDRVVDAFASPDWLGIPVDVTDAAQVSAALDRGIERFGGLDILVVAAGIFPASARLESMDPAAWRRAMAVNVDAVADLYRLTFPLLRVGQPYGRVVLIASKNVAAPGPGAAAYSSSKAAVTQLTRVAALEWASDGIRVNMIHPDAVFDTGLWTPDLLAARAAHYGMSIDAYKRRNLLSTEITSLKVGSLAAQLVSKDFESTTGAQIPIDGGNERVI